MKKIILALALLLMVMGSADARMSGVMMSGSGNSAAPPAESCQATPYVDTFSAATDVTNATASTSVHFAGAAGYVPAANKTICKVAFKITCKYDDCSGATYYAAIYTKSGTALNTVVGEVSNGVAGDNAWDSSTVTFTFPGSTYPQVTTSGTYAVVFYSDPVGNGTGTTTTSLFYDAGAGAELNGGWGSFATDKSRTDYGAGGAQFRLYTYE